MIRLAAGIEYDGSAYNGWQYQPHAPSVQETVEAALSQIADEPIRVVCAGRTDTGVHASGQVVHFDTAAARAPHQWVMGANSRLPPDINLLWLKPVMEDFHARFRAQRRTYRYLILNRPQRSALLARRATVVYERLDVEPMQEAAKLLIGEHDFSSFRAAACQASSAIRRIEYFRINRLGELVLLEVCANAFLHHMVRNFAGSLIAVGKGEQPAQWVGELLEAKDRRLAAATAPAQGLYLSHVAYPACYALPQPEPPDPSEYVAVAAGL